MLKVELHNCDIDGNPVARFATATEVEIAEQLRHQLEERYFAPSSPSHVDSGREHRFDHSNAACGVAHGRGASEQSEA